MSLRLKTILGIALIEGALLLVLLITMMDFIRDSNYEALRKRAESTVTLFSTMTKDAVLSYDLASLEAFVSEVLRNEDLRYARIVTPDGEVFAQSGEISHFVAGRFAADTEVANVDDNVYDISGSIAEGGEVYGYVQVGLDVGAINASIAAINRWGIALASFEMVLVALFSFVLGGYLTKQLDVLRKTARKVTDGDFDVQVEVKTRDEIGEVSSAFNRMVTSLKSAQTQRDQYESELLELNQSLEERVLKRTRALQTKHVELQETYQSLKDTQAKLLQSEKLASVGVLAAGVAHEINNPIAFVMSNLESLSGYINDYEALIDNYHTLKDEPDDAARHAKLEQIEAKLDQLDYEFVKEDVEDLLKDSAQGTQRVRDIVVGLSEFAQLNQDDSWGMVDLNECIQVTLQLLQGRIPSGCKVRTSLGILSLTYGAAAQLNQALLNVIQNALQAVGEQGCVDIVTKEQSGRLIVSIRDSGTGIAAEELDKVFDPFFTTRAVGEGTGLGLAMAYGIAKDHGGEIKVKSELGKGSQFIIILPIRDETQLASAS